MRTFEEVAKFWPFVNDLLTALLVIVEEVHHLPQARHRVSQEGGAIPVLEEVAEVREHLQNFSYSKIFG